MDSDRSRIATFLFILIFFFGIFLRTYNLEKLLPFTYDQGRDAYVVWEMMTKKPIRLIGPTTGLEGVFTGPFYYYLLLPGYVLGHGDPTVAAKWMALIASLSIPVFFFFAKEAFNARAALLGSFLLAILPGPVEYSRFLFNPNPTVTVGLLFFWACWRGVMKSMWFFVPAFFLLGLLLQLEMAIAVFYVPLAFLFLLWSLRRFGVKFLPILVAVFALGITFFPLLVFDLRHQGIVSSSLLSSLQDKTTHTSLAEVWEKRPKIYLDIFAKDLFRGGFIGFFNVFVLFISIFSYLFFKKQGPIHPMQFAFFSLWLFLPMLLLLFYTGNYGFISSYYFIPQFTAGIFFLSAFFTWLAKKNWMLGTEKIHGRILVSFLIGMMVAVAVIHYEGVLDPKNIQMNISRMRQAVGFVYNRSGDERPYTSIFVANGQTEHYDYLFDEFAREGSKQTHVNLSPNDLRKQRDFFLLYEIHGLGQTILESRFDPWYKAATASSTLVEKETFGIINVERWKRHPDLTPQFISIQSTPNSPEL